VADETRPVDANPDKEAYLPTESGASEQASLKESALDSGSTEAEEPSSDREPRKDTKKKKKKKKKGGSARGVETMYRTSYRTHLDLSALADNKANIMISINGIIISILLGTGVGALGQIGVQPDFLLPTAVLLVFCLLSLVWAVLAARPRVTRRETTLDEVRAGKANILFFGNFTSLPEEDFVEGMDELVKDPQRTYTNMTRDIYGLGSVLETKYRLLRVSYTLFMLGLILGVGLFLVAFVRGAMAAPSF
jgi:hypothetical protein